MGRKPKDKHVVEKQISKATARRAQTMFENADEQLKGDEKARVKALTQLASNIDGLANLDKTAKTKTRAKKLEK